MSFPGTTGICQGIAIYPACAIENLTGIRDLDLGTILAMTDEHYILD